MQLFVRQHRQAFVQLIYQRRCIFMHSLDHQVLQQLQTWLSEKQRAWLCTIVATHGSSPRPIGSLMACNEVGQVVGSLSGGCVEEDLIEKLINSSGDSFPQVFEYGLTAEENARLGLPCGGRLTVLVEQFSDARIGECETINSALVNRRCIERRIDLKTGESSLSPVEHFKTLFFNERQCVQVYGPRFTLLLVGAGQIAECLAEMAAMMDYRVIVTDPRKDKLLEFRQHLALENINIDVQEGMPDDVVRDHASDRYSIVITLTHDPRIDDMALMEALKQECYYVGALGSTRTSEKRRTRLAALDLSEVEINKLHAPVGLSIGSKTAPEIAVAILAELTQLRRARA